MQLIGICIAETDSKTDREADLLDPKNCTFWSFIMSALSCSSITLHIHRNFLRNAAVSYTIDLDSPVV